MGEEPSHPKLIFFVVLSVVLFCFFVSSFNSLSLLFFPFLFQTVTSDMGEQLT